MYYLNEIKLKQYILLVMKTAKLVQLSIKIVS